MHTLLLIDGNSIANRAFYGIKLLSNKKGVFTNAVTGFLNIYIKLKNKFNPGEIIVAFDVKKKTFRNDLYEHYKGTRKGAPPELLPQLALIKDILRAMGTGTAQTEGYEADDIIGTLAARHSGNVIISTGDRDSLQLISGNVRVNLAGNKSDTLFDAAKLLEVYGVAPEQVVEMKSLMGDASDNIPGVKGVGEKTALTLIQKYGSAENVYAALENGTIEAAPSVKAKLSAGKENCFLSRTLAKIVRDAPADVSAGTADFAELRKILTELEMFAMISKLCKDAPPVDGNFADQTQKEYGKEKDAEEFSGEFDETLAMYLLDTKDTANLRARLKESGMTPLLQEIEIPLSRVLKDMEQAGFAVDTQGIEGYGAELRKHAAEIESAIYNTAGEKFNINSPKQLGVILFDRLHLPHGKKTKTGYSTNAEVLDSLYDKHPAIGMILEYRSLTKLISTYVDGLLKAAVPEGVGEFRIHTTFNQTETRTGRLSSSEPNIQNIPVRTERGRELRKFFAAKEGYVLADADYSQIELRILAALSQDKAMTEAFLSGTDIHTATAAAVFGVSTDMVTSDMRRAAKAVNFGIVYGIGGFSLAKNIGTSVAEAQNYINTYLKRYSGAAAYLEQTVTDATANGYTQTLFGRRRYIHELRSSNKTVAAAGRRIALNTPIQGTAADIIKIAMIRVHEKLKGTDSRLILQVHDELIIETPESEAERVSAMLKETMESAADLSVPLIADVKHGKTWYECK